MTSESCAEQWLMRAFSIIAETGDMADAIAKLRDLVGVEHLVYHSSRFGARPSVEPYIQLTYPDSWVKRYLQMGYVDVDPVLREGFKRTLPFDWSELQIETPAELAFLTDALAHGVGPSGYSIPVRSKQGHRALLSMSSSMVGSEWTKFVEDHKSPLIEVANSIHRRVIHEVFGEAHPHLTPRELDCLRWVASGKNSNEIAVILDISPHTAREYLKSSRHKLDAVTSAQAVNKAVQMGLLVL
jgi:LuxR family transcriptional regulator, quorum-sensing system regulator CinR